VKIRIFECCGRPADLKPYVTFNIPRKGGYIKDHCVYNMLTFNDVFLNALKTSINMFTATLSH
jgi:hypothetical protein